jgi:hypothetical protein
MPEAARGRPTEEERIVRTGLAAGLLLVMAVPAAAEDFGKVEIKVSKVAGSVYVDPLPEHPARPGHLRRQVVPLLGACQSTPMTRTTCGGPGEQEAPACRQADDTAHSSMNDGERRRQRRRLRLTTKRGGSI